MVEKKGNNGTARTKSDGSEKSEGKQHAAGCSEEESDGKGRVKRGEKHTKGGINRRSGGGRSDSHGRVSSSVSYQ